MNSSRSTSRSRIPDLASEIPAGVPSFVGALAILGGELLRDRPVPRIFFSLVALVCLTVLGFEGRRRFRYAFRSLGEGASLRSAKSEEIDALYRDLRRLERQSPEDPDWDAVRESKLSRLRELQREEATTLREQFEKTSNLRPGSGLAALRNAKRLLGRDENPAAPNQAPVR